MFSHPRWRAWSRFALLGCLAWWPLHVAIADDALIVVVMDPLAAPLSCPCVEGYAQRDYEQLAIDLEQRLDRSVDLYFSESLGKALQEKTGGEVDLIIGKDSMVRSEAEELSLPLQALAHLTGKDGATTQTGLLVVRAQDPAQSVADLQDYRILFGPSSADEKHAAAKALLVQAGIKLPETCEVSEACSDGACQVIEWGDEVRAAAVISSYAQPLLEGCGTIAKGELRVIAETAPVPFITAFANADLDAEAQARLQTALFDAGRSADVRSALETLQGFVPASDETASSAVAGRSKKN